MFSFDPSALPQITARRAFIGIDFQRAFSSNGALPVVEPEGYVGRANELAAVIRELGGDVIWFRSNLEQSASIEDDRVVVSDKEEEAPAPERGRPTKVEPGEAEPTHDKEAFLSRDTPDLLAEDGAELSSDIVEKMANSDVTLTKSTYSAFEGTKLLHTLRAKMVMEIFICGSLANVGVHATAIDAAGHGFGITIVEDCCGYRSEPRLRRALKNLTQATGCEITSLKDTVESFRSPPPPPARRESKRSSTKSSSRSGSKRSSKSTAKTGAKAPDLVQAMSELALAYDDPKPAEETAKSSPDLTREAKGDATGLESDTVKGASSSAPDLSTKFSTTTTYSLPEETKDREPALSTPQQTTPAPGQTIEAIQDALSAVVLSSRPASPLPTIEEAPIAKERESPTSENVQEEKEDKDDETPQEALCEGDTHVVTDLLPKDLEDEVFDQLRKEVKWQRMSHQGGEVPRLVAVQGATTEDGSIPVYRHPSDESPPLLPFSPTVLNIKAATEKHLGHSLNHVLIQFYRDGNDFISEHSDKTLDIAKNSYIANVSLGAERTMVLRTKRQDRDISQPDSVKGSSEADKRQVCRARLPHNSLLRMGLKTNMKWLHSIRQDKRAQRDKTAAELAFGSGRISLTFRNIGTFLSSDETLIWGQGATSKTKEKAKSVINGQGPEAIEMLRAFGTENRSSSFDWESHYGNGFDVLHMSTSARFFASDDSLVNMQVTLTLAELGINYAKGAMGPGKIGATPDLDALPIKFVDNVDGRPTVHGDVAILSYLDAVHNNSSSKESISRSTLAKRITRFHQAISLSRKLQREMRRAPEKLDIASFTSDLSIWDHYGAEGDGDFMAGPFSSLPDFVVWPVLYTLVQSGGPDYLNAFSHLKRYYETFRDRESAKKICADLSAADGVADVV